MFALIILWTKSRELRPDRELYVRSSVFNAANLASLHVIFPLIKLWQVLYCKKDGETMAPHDL